MKPNGDGRWHDYRLYGVTFRSQIHFPELEAVKIKKSEDPDFRFRQGGFRFTGQGKGQPFWGSTFYWSKDQRTAWIESLYGNHFCVRIPEGEVVWKPSPSSSPECARHLLKGKVLAFLLSCQPSFLVLHGNVVTMKGKGVAFCGAPGEGKSTLTASLLKKGALLHSDDVAAIHAQNGSLWVEPGPPEIRLWPHAFSFLDPFYSRKERVFPETVKKRFFLKARYQSGASKKRVGLETLYLLSRQRRGRIRIDTLSLKESILKVLGSSYLPVFRDQKILSMQFELANRLVRETPVKVLVYPSGMKHLPEVTDAVFQDLKRLGPLEGVPS